MKPRFVAGILASLAMLVTVSAEAAPKKRGSGGWTVGPTKPAAVVTTPASAHAPASRSRAHKHQGSGKHAGGKHTGVKHGDVIPASVIAPATADTATPVNAATTANATTTPKSGATASNAHDNKPVATKPAAAKSGTAKTGTVKTGSSKHGAARGAKSGKTKVAKPSRFIVSGVPLSEVRDGRLHAVGSAKHPCGTRAAWAQKGSAWTPLDAWGQVLANGSSTIVDRRFFDGSGCYEVSFHTASEGTEAPKVWVAKGSGYTPAASAKWSPASDVAKRFEHLYAAQQGAWVEGKPEASAERGKTLFFALPKQDGSVEGAPTQRRPTHWAVSGGRVLVVGYVSATGAWKVGHVLPPNGKDHAYEPIAVLDMNGDGLPEIVVHEEAGGVFSDRVLSFDAGNMRWEKAVESPGGASR